MNSVLTLEENSGEYLKQETKHSKYEFQTIIHYISDMKKKNGRDKMEGQSHSKGRKRLQIRMTHESM